MVSIRSSSEGNKLIKQALHQRGWSQDDDEPLVLISRHLAPEKNWGPGGPYIEGHSNTTWKRFLQGKKISADTFKNFCWVLNLKWNCIADITTNIYWDKNVTNSSFFGRETELKYIESTIFKRKKQLIFLTGFAGIGKTSLAIEFAKRHSFRYKYIIEKSFIRISDLLSLLDSLLDILTENQICKIPSDLTFKVDLLIGCLSDLKCLIILNDFDFVAQEIDDISDTKSETYDMYVQVLRNLVYGKHCSDIIITSRYIPRFLSDIKSACEVFSLKGLNNNAILRIFEEKSVYLSENQIGIILSRFGRNPFFIKIIAGIINENYSNNTEVFLKSDVNLSKFKSYSDAKIFIISLIKNISDAEKKILYWLAINYEPISISTLINDCKYMNFDVNFAVGKLSRRALLQIENHRVVLHPFMNEIITEFFVNQFSKELLNKNFDLIRSHSLVKNDSKEYIRNYQKSAILRKIIANIVEYFKSSEKIVDLLKDIIKKLKIEYHNQFSLWVGTDQNTDIFQKIKGHALHCIGYSTGNIINIIENLNIEFSELDFSYLPIVHADFSNIIFKKSDFRYCHFVNSKFIYRIGSVLSLSFSPDGNTLASSSTEGTISYWNVSDWNLRSHITKAHNSWIMSIAYSFDGTLLATCCEDGSIKVWNNHSGSLIASFDAHSWVYSLSFTKNSKYLISGSENSEVNIWNIDKKENLAQLKIHKDRVWSVAISHKYGLIASGGDDARIQLTDLKNQTSIGYLDGHKGWVTSLDFSPDEKYLISGSTDKTVKLWDVLTQKCLYSYENHQHWIIAVAFDKDGKTFASAGEDRTVRVWELSLTKIKNKDNCCISIIRGFQSRIWDIKFSPIMNILTVACDDRTITIWDPSDGKCIHKLQGYQNWIMSVDSSSSGDLIVSAMENNHVAIWNRDLDRHKLLSGHSGRVWSVAICGDCKKVASCSDDQTIKLWDISTGKCTETLEGHSSIILDVSFNNDGNLLASVGEDRNLKIWNLGSKSICRYTLQGHTNRIRTVAFSTDDKFVFTSGEDGTTRIWDVGSGTCLNVLENEGDRIFSISLHPSNQLVACAGNNKNIVIWNFSNRSVLRIFEEAHSARIRSLSFNFSGDFLASAGEDYIIKIWNFNSGKCVKEFKGHTDIIRTVKFVGNTDNLVSCSQDGSIRVWSLNCSDRSIISVEKPYSGLMLADAKGLSSAQFSSLKYLGAKLT